MRHGFLTQGCTDPYIPRSWSHWDCHLVPLTALLAPTLGYPCSSCYMLLPHQNSSFDTDSSAAAAPNRSDGWDTLPDWRGHPRCHASS
jgi:hypothetical protein